MYTYIIFLCVLISSISGHEGHDHPPPADIRQIDSFNDPKVVGNEEHMKEHMKNEMNTDKPLTPEEMEFHYFRLHDVNNDTKLDGLEILKALSHMVPAMQKQQDLSQLTPEQKEYVKKQQDTDMFPRFVMIIDKVLLEDDINRDGYISYPEYISARRRDVMRMREHMERQQFQQQQFQQQQQQQQQFQNQPVQQQQQLSNQPMQQQQQLSNQPMQYQNQPQQQQFQNQAQFNQPPAQPNQQQFQQHPPQQQFQQHPPQQQFQQQPNQQPNQNVPPGVNPQHYQ